jgi:tryptophan synthase beta chain
MSDSFKCTLGEERIPRSWYNIAADLPFLPRPLLHPGGQPASPDDLAPLSPMTLNGREGSTERQTEIPDPVREMQEGLAQ